MFLSHGFQKWVYRSDVSMIQGNQACGIWYPFFLYWARLSSLYFAVKIQKYKNMRQELIMKKYTIIIGIILLLCCGCKKKALPAPEYPLSLDVLNTILKEESLEWTVTENDLSHIHSEREWRWPLSSDCLLVISYQYQYGFTLWELGKRNYTCADAIWQFPEQNAD